MKNYINLLVSVIHPAYGMTINRYCMSISLNDNRMQGFDVDRWAEPSMRQKIRSLLCEDWLSDGCSVVSCELIAGAVQWGAE